MIRHRERVIGTLIASTTVGFISIGCQVDPHLTPGQARALGFVYELQALVDSRGEPVVYLGSAESIYADRLPDSIGPNEVTALPIYDPRTQRDADWYEVAELGASTPEALQALFDAAPFAFARTVLLSDASDTPVREELEAALSRCGWESLAPMFPDAWGREPPS